MDVIDQSHVDDLHRHEFEEYVYDNRRTAEDLRHLLMKQYDDIQELKRSLHSGNSMPASRPQS